MPNPAVEVIIKAKDLASGVVKGFASRFERNFRVALRTAKNVARDLLGIGAAATGAAVALQKMGERGAKVLGVQSTFTKLTEGQAGALERLRVASRGAASDFDLMQYYNQAAALGVVQTSDDMERLISIATKLSKSLGQDVAYGIESLTTGIGRQSKLFLDNLGILIDVEKANKAYADALGRDVSTLTELEKKEAFRNAALAEGERLTDKLGGTTDVTAGSFERLAAALENIKDNFTKIIAQSPAISNFFETWAKILQGIATPGGVVGAATAASVANITNPDVLQSRLRGVRWEMIQAAAEENAALKAVQDATEAATTGRGTGARGLLTATDRLEAVRRKLADLKAEADAVKARLDAILNPAPAGGGGGGGGGTGPVTIPGITGPAAGLLRQDIIFPTPTAGRLNRTHVLLEDAAEEFDNTANIVVGSLADMGAAAIRGTDQVTSSVLNMIGNLLERVVGPEHGILGSVLGGVFGLGAALFSRNDRPKVVVDDYSATAQRKMSEADQRPQIVHVTIEQGGVPIEEIQYELANRQERDAVIRIPGGSSVVRG